MRERKLRPHGNPCSTRPARRSQTNSEQRRNNINGCWGDRLTPEKTGFRIGFQNINGLPVVATHAQHSEIQKNLTTFAFDIFGAQEINLNLHRLEPMHTWQRRFKGSPFFQFAATNEHTTSHERRLFGGTAMFLAPNASARTSEHGKDPSGLGRWTWALLTGKRGIRTRIINGYRPVRDFSNRPGTVFSQQEKFFHEQGLPRDPRKAFLDDLQTAIGVWTNEGDQIILGLDLNEFIHSNEITTWVGNTGLIPTLAKQHPRLPLVDTCDKSHSQRPIDGIWTSPGIAILQCGMTGFGELVMGPSDHRLLWMDVDPDSIFGYSTSPIPPRPKELFSIQDPLAVRHYNNYVRRQRLLHRIPDKLALLQQKAVGNTFTQQDVAQYSQLCALDDGIRTQARRKSRRFYAGQVQYSDVIGNDYQELRMWQLVLKRRAGRRTDTRHIRRLMVKTEQPTALRMTLEEATAAQKNCFKRYLQHKKDQHKLREKFERKQDERIAEHKGITLSAQQKLRKHTRQARHSFSHIRTVISSKPKTLLHTVEYTTADASTVECVEQREVESACQDEGQRRFSQAETTPFLTGSLHQDLGYLANQQAADRILMGQYQCDIDVDKYTKLFISELKIPHTIFNLPSITGLSSHDDHTQAWLRMRPNTASSPFGPSFMDYIAGANHKDVAAIDNLFASIPIQAAFCPEPWVKAVDVMIPKKQSSINVEKLRIIVLFHALFNLINKRVGRSVVRRALEHNQIPLEAFGSVPGKQANVCTLNKALVNDILRQHKRPAALCSNDATACYDRIVHVVASLCLQRLGVDAKTCQVMFGTLQELKHYVSTAYGVSAQAYGGLHIPLQGVGQGNGAGPAIWLVMTIPLINMLRRQGFGFKSISPISLHECHLACFTYVDDTDTIHAPLNPTVTCEQVVREIQQAIDTWSGGLHATGGILSPAKSYWYLIDFKWHPGSLSWRYKTIPEAPGELHFKSPTGRRTNIDRLEPSRAVETLGIPLAMDGSQEAIVNSLGDKVQRWASKIQTKQLTKREILLSLHSGLSKSLDYSLVATRLTKQQCATLMQPLRRAALTALGIPLTFPTTLVHSPREFLGLEFPHLWFEQGFAQLQCLLSHTSNIQTDSTAQLYHHAIEGMRMELGLLNHPLTYSYYQYHQCTTITQLHIVWQFCTDLDLSLKDSTTVWQLPRQNDQCLMETFCENGFSAKELRLLNICRLYLRVIFVSDFGTGDGLSIDCDHKDRRTPFTHHNKFCWPRAGKPTNHCWALWDRAINTLIHCEDRRWPLRLKKPLGKWQAIPEGWNDFIDITTNRLFRRQTNGRFQMAQQQTRRYGTRNPIYRATLEDTNPPTDTRPTTIRIRGETWMETGHQPALPPVAAAVSTWWGTIIRRPQTLDSVIQGLQDGTAIVLTDGSFKNGLGTAAYALRACAADPDGIDAVNITPGWPEEVDPYRAELGGIYGCIRLVNMLGQLHHIPSGGVTLACDCISALQRVTQPNDPPPKTPHYDIITACRSELLKSPFQWRFRHVKGHQDNYRSYDLLDPFSRLNVDMDLLAKSYWHMLDAHRPPPFSLPHDDSWSLWNGPHRLTSWDRSTAQKLFFNRSTITYWKERHKTTGQVDWEACGMAFRRATGAQQLWIPRWLTSFLPTGNRARYIPTATTDLCPRCNEHETHRYHVIRCTHSGARQIWTQSIHNLESWLDMQHTKPSLKIAILGLLKDWYAERPWQLPNTTDLQDGAVFAAQQHMGIEKIFDGLFVTSWAETQHRYYQWLDRRTTGQRWLARLILKLWEIAWDLWSHRYKVMNSPDSLTIARQHIALDEAIMHAYDSHTPNTPRHLTRWFARSIQTMLAEPLDFKRQWLEMIATITGNA